MLRSVDSQRSQISETLPTLEPKNTTTLNVNSECFKPKQTIPYVESFVNEGEELVGHVKGHSTGVLSTAIVYCQNNRGELFPSERFLIVGLLTAPYLATRFLKQLAIDDCDKYPLAEDVIMSHVYMDDLLTGADDLESGRKLQEQLVSLLRGAGMELHKWSASNTLLLPDSMF
ncbi:integrase catalytic domain-containing protein [Trichonephila clavata]|uniref:Integrase catalytic domain-containing protein n=1 Tax=Trichonephila clavata TaxID=2740835 RepID=A0A8X6I4G5_TRICU|nr:integrase catalytic domain-containing protein [Trichonephila clavata]